MSSSAEEITDLYVTYRRQLLAQVRRIVRDTNAAEDVVQQAFVNVMGGSTIMEQRAAYVRRAAHNLALNLLRDTRRRGQIELAGVDATLIADDRAGPEMTVLVRAELRRVLAAIAALPPRRREAFILCRFDGLTYNQIAGRMGISRNTVISQVVAALADLQRSLGEP